MNCIRTLSLAFAAAAGFLAVAGGAGAEIYPFGRARSQLTAEDIRLLDSGTTELLRNGKIGSVSSWKNDKTGNFGTTELERIFQAGGVPCRRLDHVIKFKGEADPRLFQLTYCRIGNQWKLAE